MTTISERLIKNTLVTLFKYDDVYDVRIVGAGTGHYYKGNRYDNLKNAKQCFNRYCKHVSSPRWNG